MAPLGGGSCGFAFLDPDLESPGGCEPPRIRLPTALDRDARRGSVDPDYRVDPTGAVASRTVAGGRSGSRVGRRGTRFCTRRCMGPGPIGGPALAFMVTRTRWSAPRAIRYLCRPPPRRRAHPV